MKCLPFLKLTFVNISGETCNKICKFEYKHFLFFYNFMLHVQLKVFVSQHLIGFVITETI